MGRPKSEPRLAPEAVQAIDELMSSKTLKSWAESGRLHVGLGVWARHSNLGSRIAIRLSALRECLLSSPVGSFFGDWTAPSTFSKVYRAHLSNEDVLVCEDVSIKRQMGQALMIPSNVGTDWGSIARALRLQEEPHAVGAVLGQRPRKRMKLSEVGQIVDW